MNSKEQPRIAVGYIRVSTDMQAQDGRSLEGQAESIRKACVKRGWDLTGIWEDVASAADPWGTVRRPGLADAVERARREGAVLVITEPTRLFRNVAAAREFLRTLDVPVYSTRRGRIMKAPALLRAIELGEENARRIREGTVDALATQRSGGAERITSEVRKKAAKNSAKARTQKAEVIATRVAQVIQRDPTYRYRSHRELADLLNKEGILTGWSRPWTQNSVRDVRKKAMELLDLWNEVDGIMPTSPEVLTTGQEIPKHQPTVSSSVQPAKCSDEDEEEDELAELRSLPTFGMF